MDVPVTENHKVDGASEHVTLKETVTNAVDTLSTNNILEVGQGDHACIKPPSETAVQVDSNKIGQGDSACMKPASEVLMEVDSNKIGQGNDASVTLPSETSVEEESNPKLDLRSDDTLKVLEDLKEKVNNEESKVVPITDTVSIDRPNRPAGDLESSTNDIDTPVTTQETTSIGEPSVVVPAGTEESIASLEVSTDKSTELDPPSAQSPLSNVSSGDMDEDFEDDVGPSSNSNHDVTLQLKPTDKVDTPIVEGSSKPVDEKSSDTECPVDESSIPSEAKETNILDKPEDNESVEPVSNKVASDDTDSHSKDESVVPCEDELNVAPDRVEEDISKHLIENEAVTTQNASSPSTGVEEKATPNLVVASTEEDKPVSSVLPPTDEPSQNIPLDEAAQETTPSLPSTKELLTTATSEEDLSANQGPEVNLSREDAVPEEVAKICDSKENDLKSPGKDAVPEEVTKICDSKENDLKSPGERPKSALPEEETSTNLSEAGDDDQEMQEFEHVSSKDTDGDKELGEPMSVEVVDESVDESMEVNTIDEDPIGLANEPETKLDDNEEPMDVDDTSDKEKSQEVPEKTATEDEKDLSTATATDLPADKANDSLEVITGDKSGAEQVDASSTVTPGDTLQDESKEADEEICIIPDTIRTIGSQGVPDKTQTTGTEKPGDSDNTPDDKTNDLDKSDKDKGKDDKVKQGVGRPAGKRVDKSVASVEVETIRSESGRPQRLAAKKAVSQIKELAKEDSNSNDGLGKFQAEDIKEVVPSAQMCYQCCRVTSCKYQMYIAGQQRYLCQEPCYKLFRNERDKASESPVATTQISNTARDFVRKCGQCATTITGEEKNLSWETMDFCNEECLGKYQTQLGSFCANCKGPTAPASLGKYCVRFGYDIKQFCCSTCLEEFKKGLKVCSYCQKDISSGVEGFLAPVGDKGQFKDFCTQKCMEKYDNMSNNVTPPVVMHECAVCNNEMMVKFEFILNSKLHKLCSEPCFAAFKFVNNVKDDQCDMCKKFFDKVHTEVFTVYYDETPHSFCCKTCMNVYILANRKIVPCNWCKVKKYNFDMIKRVVGSGQVIMMCSLNCLTLYQVSVSAVSSKRIKCDMCSGVAQAQYHLTMSDATIRNFCSYNCVMSFQGQYGKTPPLTITGAGDKAPVPAPAPVAAATLPIPTGGPKRVYPTRRSVNQTTQNDLPSNSLGPVISSVTSLAASGQANTPTTRSQAHKVTPQANNVSVPVKQQVLYKQQLLVKPPAPKVMRNKLTSCKPMTTNKGVSCRPLVVNKETQTDDNMGKPVLIPIPVPIYVPAPMHMFNLPFPVPVPFPLPIPVPMFIPTTRNSAQGIMREIKRIQEKIPTDPFEAELLMMAEMVADDKKPTAESDSESDAGDNDTGDVGEAPGASSAAEGGFSPEVVDTSNFGEDMLQMALKMASELEEPAVDLEAALTPSTITAQSNTSIEHNDTTESEVDDPEPVTNLGERATRGRKRSLPTPRRTPPSKRGRRVSSSGGGDMPLLPPPEPANTPRIEQEKPDANMCLKYTFGVNAWRQWVSVKNSELEKAASNNRKLKLFKPEILQLTSDELNYSLCLFVKEVRKPNGTEYAPDTIYYLVLGIQQYLFENSRIDNIFTDPYYEKFTECLDEVAKKFAVLYNDQQYIVTRVEEEHLWESKQLGAHSPHVLLSTLMFFNTKHFNLTTVEEHMQLSFSHIMKHWKRNPNQPGGVAKVPGSRNVLLRFYPPQSSLEANSKKKKVYEQQENEENPLRCPVKLYEFYLSKCPESVKTRNDVFYLLPERSCVPDSPVWYSTMALGKDPLMKMLHRVKMVKEINIALLQT